MSAGSGSWCRLYKLRRPTPWRSMTNEWDRMTRVQTSDITGCLPNRAEEGACRCGDSFAHECPFGERVCRAQDAIVFFSRRTAIYFLSCACDSLSTSTPYLTV
jgi:hypothetical protein